MLLWIKSWGKRNNASSVVQVILCVSSVFDESGGVKDTVYLNSAQTRGTVSGTVLVNFKLNQQLLEFAKQ